MRTPVAPTLYNFAHSIDATFEEVQAACELLGIKDRNGKVSASMAVFRREQHEIRDLLGKEK